jgi:hypothetical protein
MKKYFVIICLLVAGFINAQKGEQFPTIKGVTLAEKEITVPAMNEKYTLVAIAFHRKAEDDLKKWLNPLYNSFIQTGVESNKGIDMADVYEVNFVFIPMISGFKKLADDFKAGTDKGFWPYIMDTEKTDIKALQKQLKVEDNKIPYFYMLDSKGKIVDVESGPFSKNKLSKLEDAAE